MIAGYQALRNGKAKEQMAEKASALSLSLRTKIAKFLAADKEFQQTWFADAGATVDTEAGNPATTWQEYIETAKRPHKWTDSWMIQAAAVLLKTEIHVLKWCSRTPGSPAEWVYLDVCRPHQKSKAVSIVLCLKDGHFTGVDPDSVLPVYMCVRKSHFLNSLRKPRQNTEDLEKPTARVPVGFNAQNHPVLCLRLSKTIIPCPLAQTGVSQKYEVKAFQGYP